MNASRLRVMLSTLPRLGPVAVATVAVYRLVCRCGLYRWLLPVRPAVDKGLFFAGARNSPTLSPESKQKLLDRADAMLAGESTYFSRHQARIGSPPDWFFDPFRNRRIEKTGHWSMLDEFADGDIKVVWEPSRFEWLPLLAQAWIVTGEDRYHSALNSWLQDWVKHNPPNTGPNWKCGQEASIRLLNLLLTARLLGTHRQPSKALVDLVRTHCERIRPTIRYAMAQNNNHGTSEAAAMFVGGAWLLTHSGTTHLREKARHWRNKGRNWLEDRVSKLIEEDGSFSQYSTNYHRVLLDTLNQVELWRRELAEAPFSRSYFNRSCSVVEWLAMMIDARTGDVPNFGANDGARLYNLSASSYRDFRPSVQLGSALFKDARVYENDTCDEQLSWLGLVAPAVVTIDEKSRILSDGGYVIIRHDESWGVLRAPNFRFRPGHADALHLDMWYGGKNFLRDGGTYSYNTDPRWLSYFSGNESHNTVQFDGHDQMPRLGRFLFGAWLKMDEWSDLTKESDRIIWSGAYRDYTGCRHRRIVEARDRVWRIIDEVSGFRNKAVLRWRLMPDAWNISGQECDSESACIEVKADGPLRRLELVAGWESRHYLEKTELPVLEAEAGPGTACFITTIQMKG